MLGIDITDEVELYFSNRTWITLGCGGFLLTRYVPGLERIFVNRKHLVWYRSIEECLRLISEYLKKDEERKKISEEGYRFVHENHTYDHVAKRILEAIG
jgi:spore maturation protein CgeB